MKINKEKKTILPAILKEETPEKLAASSKT